MPNAAAAIRHRDGDARGHAGDRRRHAPGAPTRPPDSDRQQDRHSSSRDSRQSSSSGWLSSSGAIDHGRFAPGTLLGGRYRIIERLGRGGMGEVYRADDLKLGQPVALKFLPPDVDRDPARLTQLHTEVRMARQVSHPNVCRVYDIDEVDGTTFLSMEYVDGEDLSSLLKRIGRFPEDRALEIARQICAGLAAAHERDVIHRDLKPANVMLDGTGKVRITDFGLAGASGEAIRAGTPAYMAPEQLSGQEVTARSDIYALGLVLYELFTGQRALDGKNLAELIHKREQSGILPPTTIVKSLDLEDRARDPAVPAAAGRRTSRVGARRRRVSPRRRSAGSRAGRGRNAFARDGRCRRRARGAAGCGSCRGDRVVPRRDDRDRRHVPARAARQPSLDPEAASRARGSGAGTPGRARIQPYAGRSRVRPHAGPRLRSLHRPDVNRSRSMGLAADRFGLAPSSSGTAPARRPSFRGARELGRRGRTRR